MEGVSEVLLGAVRDAATLSPRAKAGGVLLRPALRGLRDELDPEGPGGAYLLGLRQLGVVPHGRFTRYGFSQAILLAARGARAATSSAGRTRRWRPPGALRRRRRPIPRLACPRHDPRRGLPARSASILQTTRPRSRGDRRSMRASRRTSRPIRWTSTRSSRSWRTPTASRCPTSRQRGSSPLVRRSTSSSPTLPPPPDS